MKSGRIEPLRALPVPSGGAALPPATPVGQIYTMYIDFPLDENTLTMTRPDFQPPSKGPLTGHPWEAPGGPGAPPSFTSKEARRRSFGGGN